MANIGRGRTFQPVKPPERRLRAGLPAPTIIVNSLAFFLWNQDFESRFCQSGLSEKSG
jgi:hypothetical protein